MYSTVTLNAARLIGVTLSASHASMFDVHVVADEKKKQLVTAVIYLSMSRLKGMYMSR